MSWSVSAAGSRELVKQRIEDQCKMAIDYKQMTQAQADAVIGAVDLLSGDSMSFSAYGHNHSVPGVGTSNFAVSYSANVTESGLRAAEENAKSAGVVGTSDVTVQPAGAPTTNVV